jgi:hypothetical protein
MRILILLKQLDQFLSIKLIVYSVLADMEVVCIVTEYVHFWLDRLLQSTFKLLSMLEA